MRPRNETTEDLAREEAARLRFAKHLNTIYIAKAKEAKRPAPAAVTVTSLHDADGRDSLYRCDWAILQGQALIGWAEYKYRGPAKWGDYPSTLLSLSKWMYMKTLAQQSLRPFFLVFEWSDQLVAGQWKVHTGMGYDITWGGRYDRDQHGDAEPVILLPNSEFKVINV